MDDEIRTKLSLDGIITPVDARHVVGHIDDFDEVRWQIAFADVTLRSKTARVSPTDLNSLESRIRAMNAAARFYRTKDAAVELDRILNLGGFDLQRALEVDPAFMEPEYPFAWTGLYAVAAGTYFVTLNRGPDPSLNLTFLEAKEHTSEAMWQTVQQAALAFFGAKIFVPPRNAISSHTEFVQLRLDTAPIRFPVTIPNRGVWVFFTEHHPDEFFAVLQHIDGQTPPPHLHTRIQVGPPTRHRDHLCRNQHTRGTRLATIPTRLSRLLTERGPDIFRMKGILNFRRMNDRYIFQGVHMLFDGRPDRPWGESPRRNSLVFIGRNLDRETLNTGFEACLA